MADPLPELGNPKIGDALTADWVKNVNRILRGMTNSNSTGGGYISRDLGALSGQVLFREQELPVRLNERGSDPGYFQYIEVEWDTTNKVWVDKTGGFTHVNFGEAHEVTSREVIKLDEVVLLRPSRWIIDADGFVPLEFSAPIRWIWAELTGKTLIGGASNRWLYDWKEQVRTATGFADPPWTALTNIIAGGEAINGIEANNDGVGVEGHGVDIDGNAYPTGFSVQDASRGVPVVKIYEELDYSTDPATRHYTLAFENTDDGEECDA